LHGVTWYTIEDKWLAGCGVTQSLQGHQLGPATPLLTPPASVPKEKKKPNWEIFPPFFFFLFFFLLFSFFSSFFFGESLNSLFLKDQGVFIMIN